MTHDPIERYLDELIRALSERGAYSRALVEEVRDHLLDSAQAARQRGLTGDTAQREAIARTGTPEFVARHAAANVPRFRRGALLSVCAATMGAVAYLSLSLLILRPPRANYRVWSVEAAFVFALTVTTFMWAKAGGMSSRWSRPLLLLGSLVLAVIGADTLYIDVARDFEGYGLVLGTLFTTQALLTLAHLQLRPHAFSPPV